MSSADSEKPSTQLRLDEETERRIERFGEIYMTYRSADYTLDIDQRNSVLNALRSRIRELQEEAREDATRGWMLVGPAGTIFPKSDDQPLPPREAPNAHG